MAEHIELNKKTTAVLLIDMQSKFVADLHKSVRKQLLQKQTEIIRACVSLDILLIVCELQGGWSNYGTTIPELLNEVSDVRRLYQIKKTHNDAFVLTDLKAILEQESTASVVLMGLNRSYCVYQTAVSAAAYKYRVLTAEGLIADSSKVDKDAYSSEQWYQNNGVIVHSIAFS